MIAVHPGDIIREALRERGLTETALAEQIGYSLKQVSYIVTGKARLSPIAAVLIGYALGMSPRLLARVQADHDVALAVASLRREAAVDVFGADLVAALDQMLAEP